jgi:hypothetical protein
VRWTKLGRLFHASGEFQWLVSHASTPVAELLPDAVRVYFSSRDEANRSHISHFDFDPERPERVLQLADRPIIEPGAAGLFDDSGTSAGCFVEVDGRKYLYYVGWNLAVTVPWRNSIGLAIAESGGAYIKHARAPIMDRDACDPYSLSYPWVLRESGVWRMWYGSNTSWGPEQQDMQHVIKYAESADGIDWHRSNRIAIGLSAADEYAISRPCVLRDNDLYRMWYSHRGSSYRIGYAESADGMTWVRRDADVGIDVSPEGWDSEMIEYPCVFDFKRERYMLYNGNGYGRTGIGLAVLHKP